MIPKMILPAVAAIGMTMLSSPIDAQSQSQSRTMLGVRGGVSVATASLDIDDTFSKSNRTGFAGGVFIDVDGGLLGFQIAGQYVQKGTELDVANTVNDLSINYFEIPAVIKLGIPLVSVKPSIFAGAGMSFNTSCDNNGTDCDEAIKGTDFIGIAGADLAIYLGGVSLWLDGRYNFGLNDISEVGTIADDLKNRNWTFQAGLGFRI